MYTLEGKTMLAQRLATILPPESAGRKEKKDRRLFQQALIVPEFIDVQADLGHRNLLESQRKGRRIGLEAEVLLLEVYKARVNIDKIVLELEVNLRRVILIFSVL